MNVSSLATSGRTSLDSTSVPVMSGTRPQCTSRTDSCVSGCTMRMSAPRAICNPPPSAWPCTAAMHGHRHLLPHPRHLLAEVGDPPLGAARVAAACVGGVAAAGHRLERREVEPGAERRPLAREHDRSHARFRLQPLPGLGEGDEHRAVQRVALVGAVEPDVGDAIGDGEDHTVIHECTFVSDNAEREHIVLGHGERPC